MICDICQSSEAFVFLELHGLAGTKKLNLCRNCAEKFGVPQDPRSISSLFSELSEVSKKSSDEETKACPVCGKKFSAIKKSKTAGCPECYSIFKDEIRKMLDNQGIKGPYTGALPNKISTFRSVLTDRIMLQAKLEDSLAKEDYEKAAIYRDYLKALEKSPVSDNDDEQ